MLSLHLLKVIVLSLDTLVVWGEIDRGLQVSFRFREVFGLHVGDATQVLSLSRPRVDIQRFGALDDRISILAFRIQDECQVLVACDLKLLSLFLILFSEDFEILQGFAIVMLGLIQLLLLEIVVALFLFCQSNFHKFFVALGNSTVASLFINAG